jgi:aminoglycoside phosphotransferase (APT) family kinase protein
MSDRSARVAEAAAGAAPREAGEAAVDVVRTHEEADALPRPPLLVLDPLERFLDRHGLGEGPLSVEPVGEGHSNLNFLLRRGAERLVLRRPPRPPFSPSAHDVLREARVLSALEGMAVRTPAVLATSEDPSVLGVPFYVMAYVEGHVVGADTPAPLATPADRRRIAWELVDALSELHALRWQDLELERFGRPVGYLERQLRRFADLWERNRTRALPSLDRVTEWLGRNLPPSPPATIVHGDYRLGNAIFAPTAPARLRAIVDWEMATVGDPLADLGYLTATYAEPGDRPNPMGGLCAATTEEGYPARAELAARYEQRTGRAVAGLRWYQVLALWKSAVFLEGSYSRMLAGTTDDPFFRTLGEGVPQVVAAAEALVEESPPDG